MKKYVDVDSLLSGIYADNPEDVMLYISKFPRANVRENVPGHWIPHEDEDGEHYGDKCSVCGEWYVMPYGKTNFCPRCGAQMSGAEIHQEAPDEHER